MRNILARANAELLSQLAWSNVLLAFDFDGTLAPIVSARDHAAMRARTSALLTRLCGLYPCAIISGRSQADVTARLGGVPVRYVVGNHGLEPGVDLPLFEAVTARARTPLEAALRGVQGVDVEDKRYSLAIHYRASRQKRAARAAVLAAVAALSERMRVVAGKLVINVVPAEASDKGDALQWLRAEARTDTALYVGDDVTDEDVFRLDQPGRLVSVRVGASRASAASWCVPDQRDIDALLERLVTLRAKEPAR